MMKKTKIVVIGAGSASFGLTNLGAILRTPELKGSELCLVDLNAEGLKLIEKLANRINEEWKSGFTIMSGTQRSEFLKGADFVVLSVAIDREKCWKIDQNIAKNHGIMHYAENAGPGGMMHTFRNLALIMPILRDVETMCPNALVLNFTNPVARICTAAARYTKVKMVGICHQFEFGYSLVGKVLSKELGIDVPENYLFRWQSDDGEDHYGKLVASTREKVDILAAGINHFTWMLSIRRKEDGSDLYPLFAEMYLNGFENFEPLTREMFDIFKICPATGDCHMVEYLPYTHNMVKNTWDKYDIQMYPLNEAANGRNEMWNEIYELAMGNKPVDYLRDVHTERAEQIMAGILKNDHSYQYAVNIPNKGYINNLPYGAIVEVPAVVSADGILGIGIGKLPSPVAELCRRQIAITELVVEAGVKGDRSIALQALALEPMVDDPQLARALLKDYMEAFEEYLPQFTGKDDKSNINS